MKKKNFLFLILITVLFFIGRNNVYADDACEKLDDNPEYENLCVYMNLATTNPSYLYLYIKDGDTMVESTPLNEKTKYSESPAHSLIDSNGKPVNSYTYYNYINVTSCPNSIFKYYEANTQANVYHYKYTLEKNKDYQGSWLIYPGQKWTQYELKTDCKNTGEEKPTIEPNKEISCDLIDQDIIDIINEAMSYIRIGVPILLAGLIIFDFASAMFASSEDKMKKAQSKAIKRIIIAIIIFFVPTFINLIFNIANDVWSNAHFETCGIK